jgi:AraC-like DNA-binding protein
MPAMPNRFPTPQQGVVRQLAGSFQKATGLPLQFHQPGEYHVPEEDGIPPFCRLMARGSKTCERCRETHLALQDPQGREIRSAVCFAGLTSSAVPVRCGDSLLGFLHTGHASVERPARCAEPGKSCRLPGRSSRPGCAGACIRTPEMTGNRYEGAVEMLSLLADRVASSPVAVLPGGAYPAIERAVECLRADVTRHWSLTEIAKQVGMHPGYFSERFHQHVGVTFGRFLSGLRIERARHLLEFTSLPVSDVAFASGFRSLSQFNRTFKNLTGFAPGKMFPRK